MFTRSSKTSGSFSNAVSDQALGFYAQDHFHDRLDIEIKRSERSQRPFLLMLLHVEKIRRLQEGWELTRDVIAMLVTSTRDIDMKGWYRDKEVLGVLFVEMGAINPEGIRTKMMRQLAQKLPPDRLNKITISFRIFPDDQAGSSKDDEVDDAQDREKDKDPARPADSRVKLYSGLSRKGRMQRRALFFKRMIDVTFSLLGVILFAPLFLMIAMAIKLTSKGPVLFRQERVGWHGRRFTFLKFRTMVTGNRPDRHRDYIDSFVRGQTGAIAQDEAGLPNKKVVYKITNDSRVTPLGRWLRRSSLDEIPQLVNVLRGEMSLVGPRPPIPYEIERYDTWHRRRYHEVKPGITGLWQVTGRSTTTFNEMVRLDLRYARQWSLSLDLKILIRTPWVVLTGKGAY